MLEKIQPHDGIAQHIKTTQLSSELYIHVAIHHVAKINRKLLKSVCVCVCVYYFNTCMLAIVMQFGYKFATKYTKSLANCASSCSFAPFLKL